MRVLADARWLRSDGIGRFGREVLARLQYDVRLTRPPVSLFNPLEQLYLPAQILNTSPDVFFTPGINPPVLSPKPLVFAIHDLIPLMFAWETDAIKKIYYESILRIAAHRARRILTVSEFSKQKILEWSGLSAERVVVVGNGVDKRFRPDGPAHNPGFPYLLYVGNTRPHKNVEAAIEGFAASSVTDEVKLILSSTSNSRLVGTIRSCSVEDRVTFANFIPDDELPSYYRGAVALIHPSLHEGFGLPVAEAMACGTPVAAANRTAIPEVTGDAALHFDPSDIDAIAEAIRRIVRDDSLRSRLAERGPKRAAQFSWNDVARRTETALRAAVDER